MTPRRDRGFEFTYRFDFLVNGLAPVVGAAVSLVANRQRAPISLIRRRSPFFVGIVRDRLIRAFGRWLQKAAPVFRLVFPIDLETKAAIIGHAPLAARAVCPNKSAASPVDGQCPVRDVDPLS
jgi:hypothetical protein